MLRKVQCTQSMMICYAAFFILLSAQVLQASDETENKQDYKPRRAYYSGRITSLYPFPRSGRGDPDFLKLDRIVRMHGGDDTDHIPEDLEYIKPKRAYGGIQGLKPFPRTGRSDPDLVSWDNAINAISAFDDEYDAAEYSPLEIKRAQNSLFAFPRVGRTSASRYLSKAADGSQETIKRGGVGGSSGMWFGPRLGKVQKRSANPENN